MAAQGELVRVVRRSDGTLSVGRTLPGRGAWLCAGSLRCVDLAAGRKAFGRALQGPVEAPAVQALRDYMEERARMEDCGNRS